MWRVSLLLLLSLPLVLLLSLFLTTCILLPIKRYRNREQLPVMIGRT
jgi:hypothetical protein